MNEKSNSIDAFVEDKLEQLHLEIMKKIEGTFYKEINLSDIDPKGNIDIREDRSSESVEVIKSLSKRFIPKITPLLVQTNGSKFDIIDGETRYQTLKNKGVKSVHALILPETLQPEQHILLNMLINSKRRNLSDHARLVAVEKLKELGHNVVEIKEILGFSKQDIHLHEELTYFPPEVKNKIDDVDGVSGRKLEEGIGYIYSNIPETEVPKTFKDEIAIAGFNKIIELNAKRDSMSTKKVAATVQKLAKIMYPNGHSAEEVIETAFATMDGNNKSDIICEHPTKVDVVEKIIKEEQPEWFINLFCEAILYDKKNNPIDPVIVRAPRIIGGKNCTGVGFFEGIKYNYASKFEANIYQSDVYQWLSEQPKKEGKGIIFVDSFGTQEYNSKSFLDYLKNKFPGATILFLMLDQIGYRNCAECFNAKHSIMNWGIDPVNSIHEFIEKDNRFKIEWNEDSMYLLKY